LLNLIFRGFAVCLLNAAIPVNPAHTSAVIPWCCPDLKRVIPQDIGIGWSELWGDFMGKTASNHGGIAIAFLRGAKGVRSGMTTIRSDRIITAGIIM
jgi:hypothetical protein